MNPQNLVEMAVIVEISVIAIAVTVVIVYARKHI